MNTKNEKDLVELLGLEERKELVNTVSKCPVLSKAHSGDYDAFYSFNTR
jgi:hypothetical protein